MLRTLATWLALCGSLVAQEIGGLSTIPPLTEARFPVRGLDVPPGSLDALSTWAQKLVVAVDSPDGSECSVEVDIGLVKRQPVLYFSADKSGLYILALCDTGAKTPKIVTKRVQVGEVVPPAPNPTPGPGPTPPTPTVGGPRTILLIRETSQVGPAMARAEVALRSGPAAEYLKSKKHTLWILSDDQGPPKSASEAMRAGFEVGRRNPPCLVLVDESQPQSAPVCNNLRPDATAETILDAIKKGGG